MHKTQCPYPVSFDFYDLGHLLDAHFLYYSSFLFNLMAHLHGIKLSRQHHQVFCLFAFLPLTRVTMLHVGRGNCKPFTAHQRVLAHWLKITPLSSVSSSISSSTGKVGEVVCARPSPNKHLRNQVGRIDHFINLCLQKK